MRPAVVVAAVLGVVAVSAVATAAADSTSSGPEKEATAKKHKSGINAPWSLTFLNWSWGVSNSYNRDLARKERKKAQQSSETHLMI